jgi:hypothetical protein
MVPRNKGFNVVAWALPYAAVGGALVLVILLGRSWVKRRGSDDAAPPPAPKDEDPHYADKLDDELADLD